MVIHFGLLFFFRQASYYCPNQGMYTTSGSGTSSSSSYPCPTGSYCPAGSSNAVNCRVGTYQTNTLQSAISSCLSCPAPYMCNTLGMGVYPTNYCPAGYTCTGDAPVPCPISYFQANIGSTACDLCTQGRACPVTGESTPAQICQSGYLWCVLKPLRPV